MMPHLVEAWDQTDDWTGIIGTAERRKRQNRINQRASRKKKHLQRFAAFINNARSDSQSDSVVELSSNRHIALKARKIDEFQFTVFKESSHDKRTFVVIFLPESRDQVFQLAQKFFPDYGLASIIRDPSDLPLVIKLNYHNALAQNSSAMSISLEELLQDETISPYCRRGPLPSIANVPHGLHPTATQRAITHHPWIDLLPSPAFRDNILQELEAGSIDESELCVDLGDVEAAGHILRTGLVVWGDPGDIRYWEASVGFLKKWGRLLQGCPELLESTNYWREQRGEMKMNFAVNVTV